MLHVVKNNIRILLSKKGLLFLLIILPILMFTVGLGTQVIRMNMVVRVGVVDEDQSVLSKDLRELLNRDLHESEEVNLTEANERVYNGKLDAYLHIEKGYAQKVMQGQDVDLRLITLQGQEIIGTTQMTINHYVQSLLTIQKVEAAASEQALLGKLSTLDGPLHFTLKDDEFQASSGLSISSGLFLYMLSVNMLQVSGLILSEKSWNTIGRIQRSPISRSGYIMANILTSLVFLLINMVSIFILTTFIFHVRTTPSMYLVWTLYGLAWIMIGIFIALIVDSSRTYSSLNPLITTIFAMLGGCFWPITFMPHFMQRLAAITPQYWGNEAFSSLQKGATLLGEPKFLIALIGFIVLFFALSVFSMSRKKKTEAFI